MKFIYYDSEGSLTSKEYTQPLITIGRGTGCDLNIPETEVSKKHASLSLINGDFFLSDLNSTNGTFVNGELVTKKRLIDGDYIQFASFEYWFYTKAEPSGLLPGSKDNSNNQITNFLSGKVSQQSRPSRSLSFHLSPPEILKSLQKSVCRLSTNMIVRCIRSSVPASRQEPRFTEENILSKCISSSLPYISITARDEVTPSKKVSETFALPSFLKDITDIPFYLNKKSHFTLCFSIREAKSKEAYLLIVEHYQPKDVPKSFFNNVDVLIKEAIKLLQYPKENINRHKKNYSSKLKGKILSFS
ncbi:MAG: FHA domain-containing protein [Fibrobacteria bacterium]|nr:FHA domain-containing protein [Fibrobacteria bacterium]